MIINIFLAMACVKSEANLTPEPSGLFEVHNALTKTKPSDAVRSISKNDLVLAVQDRTTLTSLESSFSFAELLPQDTQVPLPEGRTSTAWLTDNHSGYRQFANHLVGRIDTIAKEIDRDLVIELHEALKYPAGNVGRRFDNRWFDSQIGFIQLVGIVNRLDKKDFYLGDSCGEIRFVYRLAYQNDTGASSRLPLTMNIVMESTDTDCAVAARRWVKPKDLTADQEIDWLRNTALDSTAYRFKQLELNAQIVRFPSGLETEFAGQALYLLRVYGYRPEGESLTLTEVPLENTPDVQKLKSETSLKTDLFSWISKNIEAIDQGTYLIPSPYLATEALSYSTLGINRLANKPFDVLFDSDGFDALPEPDGDLQWLKSKASLIDRLNNGSCVGCHQASTTAGFHFLGEDDPEISGVTNRLALPFSAHFDRELDRRRTQLTSLINGETEDTFRPHSLAPDTAVVPTNHSCILPNHLGDFQASAQWQCAPDETCEAVVDTSAGLQFGQCMPDKAALLSGQTCRTGQITESQKQSQGVFNLHAYADTFVQQQRYDLLDNKTFTYDSFNCRPTRIGVPLGRTYRRCTDDERSFGPQASNPQHPEICAVVGGAKFDSCVEKDFHSCLDSIVARGMVDSCHADRFCREDYICQAMPHQLKGVDSEKGKALSDAGVGFCTPTYFVFQLRLDGHPVPE
ncbi:MAG: hypothetical protein VXZ96_08420 [Myxococcota bacterium]|nr:hypothetical protein [Myxococcota bacterium]